MTERGRQSLSRTRDTLSIGPSRIAWEDGALTVRFDEVTTPAPSRLRGVIRLHPAPINAQGFALDVHGRHIWRPILPRARVEVSLENPAGGWSGDGYFDTNAGSEPLEDAFRAWDWSRAHLTSDTLLFYDLVRRGGDQAHLALRFGPDGALEPISPPERQRLPSTLWRIPRRIRAEAGHAPTLRETLEDTPFYARSALSGRYGGQSAAIVHESLSLNRLRSPVVRAMLPFRMPRIVR